MARQEKMAEAIRAACLAADITPECEFPACGCDQLPNSVRAAIAVVGDQVEALEAKCALHGASLKRADVAVDRLRSLLLAVCNTIEDATDSGDEMAVVNFARDARAKAAEVEW